jgi:hypothetical protein
MRRAASAEILLSLFTSPDCASGIVGDLSEESEERGTFWFWRHVIGTTLAFWRSALTVAPITVLLLAVTGALLLVVPAFAGIAARYMVPHASGSMVAWIALAAFWCGGAAFTGFSLVRIAPRRGMAACMVLAVIAILLVLASLLNTLTNESLSSSLTLRYFIGIGATALLLIGGGTARRLALSPSVSDL